MSIIFANISVERTPEVVMKCSPDAGVGSQNLMVKIEIPDDVSTDRGIGEGSVKKKPVQRGIVENGHGNDIRVPLVKLNDEATRGQLLPQRTSKKWVNSVDRDVLEIREGSLPRYPNDEEVVGIITMEDLIEELLQVELLQRLMHDSFSFCINILSRIVWFSCPKEVASQIILMSMLEV